MFEKDESDAERRKSFVFEPKELEYVDNEGEEMGRGKRGEVVRAFIICSARRLIWNARYLYG